METVVVERQLEEPLDLERLRGQRDKLMSCLNAHDVTLQHSYVAPDGKRMICVYLAPDAESVRMALRSGGVLAFETAWRADVLRPEDLEGS